MRNTALKLVLCACIAGCSALVVRADTLIVLDKSDFKAILIDPANGRAIAKLPTNPGPHEIALSPDGRTAYVTDFGRYGVFPAGDQIHSQAGNSITVLDLPAQKVKATFDLGSNKGPHGIAVSHDGKYVWVTAETGPSILDLDASSGNLLHAWETTQKGSHLLVPARDEKKLYVSNTGSGSVSVIDRATGMVKVLPTGPGTEGIGISPDGREVWVTSRGDSKVSVISTATDEVVTTFPSGGTGPARVRFTPGGAQVWILNPGSKEVSAFDARSRKLLGSTNITPNPTSVVPNPTAIVFSANGRQAYIADPSYKTVTVLDVRKRKILFTFIPGIEPEGLAWTKSRTGK